MDDADHTEEIIQARIRGESVRKIAKRLGITPMVVNETLDVFATSMISHQLRFHTLALELARLDDIQEVFIGQAHKGDIQSGMLVAKLIERRCILLGLSAPPRQDQIPRVIEAEAAPQKTSTQKFAAVIERLCASSKEASPPDLPAPHEEMADVVIDQPADLSEPKPID